MWEVSILRRFRKLLDVVEGDSCRKAKVRTGVRELVKKWGNLEGVFVRSGWRWSLD